MNEVGTWRVTLVDAETGRRLWRHEDRYRLGTWEPLATAGEAIELALDRERRSWARVGEPFPPLTVRSVTFCEPLPSLAASC
jgi:hypothetical protein